MLEIIDQRKPTRTTSKTTLMALLAAAAVLTPSMVHGEGRFTDILLTKSFQGSWENVQALGWLGGINSWVITTVSVIGLIGMSIQILLTLLYFSTRNTWDAVWDFQQDDENSGWLGLKSVFDKLKSGSRGTGVNAFLQAGLAMFPNVRYFSEMNPNRLAHNLKEEDTVGVWALKTFIPKALMIFLFSAGFDGSLMKAYYMFANGASAVMDKFVDTNLEGWITRKMNMGEAYQFTLGSSNTKSAKFGEDIAKELYSKVVGRSNVVDSSALQGIGLTIEQKIYSDFLGGAAATTEEAKRAKLASYLPKTATNGTVSLSNDADMNALSYTIDINTNPTAGVGSKVYALKDLFGNGAAVQTTSDLGSRLQAHITLTKSKSKDQDFFVVPAAVGATPRP